MAEELSKLRFLLTTEEPSVSYVVAPRFDLWQYVGHTSRPSELAVRFFQSRRMTSTAALWDEFEAVLQWPTYFGRNWNAFNDFLQNLDWIDAAAYAFVIFDADTLLEGEEPDQEHDPPDHLAALVADFHRYAERFRQPWQQSWTETRAPTPFHVIMHVEAARESHFLSRLARTEVHVPRAPFEVPSPPPSHDYTPEELELLGLLADYVREHGGRAPWGPEGTPAPPEWTTWLADPSRAPDPPGWTEWLENRG